MALRSGFSPKVLLLLLLMSSCWLRDAQSRPGDRSSWNASPSTEVEGDDQGASIASGAKGSSEKASSAAEGHEDAPAKKTLLSRQRRQGPDDPPPVPPVPPDPPLPSDDGDADITITIDPFSFFNGLFGPPRRYGGRDPITSFFSGIESFKRDLVNFFFG
ncbi:uncharacterized protein LOC124155002 [Ischnura elegans]|uniref:uncharacterized protein LOC124155002 n=1 Tax=Ischnura elegans TaxID=197161 RepID=UPI001ED88A2D|nr:uncharacterized protein LOC124155002 [Ischnura elegans]